MAILHGLLLAATVYGWAALAGFLFLVWKWQGVENGLRPAWVAAAWPAVLPGLAAYYAAACLYTLGIVLNARWKAGPRHRLPAATRARG
ncbi:hypothetical protein Q8W71_04590 [Methylobacterium sp. NEAU 140]|uniref:hypothetical protein n=1 Tax=Methylobacterium sp. NEAU 140 TaxID=3064945 RepID=UPI00273240A8|nr:hypothetical protein [Methylobacterium sp. NEAU 140]MDP4021895.1 hypothetical protein [Methylobacterium sp. NEAU 140]